MDTAIQTNLTGDDAMAFNFLSRAANALVSASDLSRQVAALSDKLDTAEGALSILDDIKRTQDERIATLEAQLRTSIEAEGRATATVADLLSVVAARQRDIDLLDGTVADLRAGLAAMTSDRDQYRDLLETAEAERNTAQAKIRGVEEALGKVGMSMPAIPEPSLTLKAEPDYRDYAEKHPEYRAAPGKDTNGRSYLTYDQAKPGTLINTDGSSECWDKDKTYTLIEEDGRLGFVCNEGWHGLKGQEAKDGDWFVGLYPANEVEHDFTVRPSDF